MNRAWVTYEEVAHRLADQLARHLGTATTSCEHNIVVQGSATSNQVDVLWEGVINGQPHRVVIECKHYARRLDKGHIHKFSNVVRDIRAAGGPPTTGVFITPIGYQSGAAEVARHYDVVLLEMRDPTAEDLKDRVVRIDVTVEFVMPHFVDVRLGWLDQSVDEYWPDLLLTAAAVQGPGGEPILLGALLAEQLPGGNWNEVLDGGQTASPAIPVELHFDEPHLVTIDGIKAGTITGASAIAKVARAATDIRVGPGADGVAAVVKNALNGDTAWFARDGKVYRV